MSDIDDELFALAGGDDEADVEEGEASSVAASSPNSLGSDAMEESDSEADNDDDVPARSSEIPYPLEGKYIDSKDKARINSLPQLERERILGERAEELNKAQWAAELSRRAREKELQGTPDRKRKASSIEPDDSQRKSSRQKVKGKNDKLEAYKREREQRGQQRQRHDDDHRGRRRSSSYDSRRGSDVDADGESEVEYTDYREKSREKVPAELNHFESVRVGRGFFANTCFDPGFEETMTGCYVRVGTGQDSQRRTLYKMAQIKEFVTGKPYVMDGNKPGERIATDQYVRVKHGETAKEYNFTFLSNQRFTQAEFDAFRQSLAEANGKWPLESELKEKWEAIVAFRNHSWKDNEVTERLNKRRKYAHLLSQRSEQPHIPTQTENNARRIAELNNRNRRLDSERVRKALIEEQRQKKLDRQRAIERKRKEEEEAARKKAEEEKAAQDDLFGGDDTKTEDAQEKQNTPKPAEKEQQKGLPTFRKPKLDDDIIASLDIGVEIEI